MRKGRMPYQFSPQFKLTLVGIGFGLMFWFALLGMAGFFE